MSKLSLNSKISSTDQICHCEDNIAFNLIVASPGCGDDFAAVATLPDHWIPRRSGPILANYLKQREENHGKALSDFLEGAAIVNGKIDAKVRELTEQLLAYIEQNDRDIDCIVESCDTNEIPLSTEARSEALMKVKKLFNDRVDDLASFRRDALGYERERADGLRNLLRNHFQKFVAVGHQTLKDLLLDFDGRIYEVDQQFLSNATAYEEFVAQLRAEADEYVIKARSALNQLCLGVSFSNRRHSAHPRTTEERLSIKRSISASEKKRNSSDPSVGLMGSVEDEIDACVSRLVDAYRKAVLKVFSGFSGKLTDLHNSLTNYCTVQDEESHTCGTSDLIPLMERALRRLSSNIHKQVPASKDVVERTHNDTISLQRSLWSLGERLRDTFNILHDAAHLWDAHMLRSALAQKLAMAAVEDMLSSNDTIEQANEVAFNVALEQLRVASDHDKLQHQYDTVVLMLERTAEMYLQHSTAELGKLEEFLNLHPLMSAMLLAEINCFLESNPRSPLTNTPPNINETSIASPSTNPAQERSILPRAILQTELQEVALMNWRNGFLEAFESNVSFVPDELMRQAQQWVDEKSSALHMRYSMKLVSHSIRLERVKAARDIRLAELHHHETRLESHLNAIYKLVDDLPEKASQFLSLQAKELYPICEWVDRIQTEMDGITGVTEVDPEVKRLKMNSFAPRLSKYRRLFEESLDVAIQEFKNNVEQRIQEGRVSNVRFISQIRMFNERGRFSAPEAQKASVALMKGNDALEVCSTRSLEVLNQRRSQLLALADQRLLPVQKVVEEFLKVATKHSKVDEKKKPGKSGKKK